MTRVLFTIILVSLLSAQGYAQKKDVVEISGVVVSNDSLKQFIPNCYIVIPKRGQVSTTNNEGFFSIVAVPGDTVVFSHIGFETEKLWVTDTLHDNTYLTMVVLNWDRTVLDPVIVYPWPRPENFKEEFLAMRIPTTEYDIAQRNLAIQTLKEQAAAMGYDAAEMQDYMIGLQNQALYNNQRMYGGGMDAGGGAAILGAISNPFAWAQFFDALKRGDFKSKK
jgi:hypothetical protein